MFGFMYPPNAFAAKKDEPIKLRQVWEYGPGAALAGRFVIKGIKISASGDRWLVEELSKGKEEHLYTEAEILSNTFLVKIQPDQSWLDEDGKERTIISPCDQMWIFGRRVWDWNTKRRNGSEQRIGEKHILDVWTFVDPSAATPAPVLKHDKCPLCGTRGFQCFNMFKCQNPHCRNYDPIRP